MPAAKKETAPFKLVDRLLEAFATNNRINRYLIENLSPEVWGAKPRKGRTIAEIVAHIHNVRLMWLKAAGFKGTMPAKIEGDVTPGAAIGALQESFAAISEVLQQSLLADGRIKGFKPDVASFIAYLVAHDAHHRGQVSMLARQLGHPLAQDVKFGMWEWGTR